MRPEERRDSGQKDLFRARLDQIVDMSHPLAKLARTIDWRFLETFWKRASGRLAPFHSKGSQFVAHVKVLPRNPYDGHTLAVVLSGMETQLGASIARADADRGYRGRNAPPAHQFRVFIPGQRRRVTEAIKRELDAAPP